MGDATSFYWYTEKLGFPVSGSDYVSSGDYGWYQSEYRWVENQVREVIREGEQLSDSNGLIPYRVHVRFNKDGQAIYQQYRLDDKVRPLNEEQLLRYQQEASSLVIQAKDQNSKGVDLIQGYWDGTEFETCSGRTYTSVEFNHALPSFVINRLASIDSYVAFLGSTRGSKVVVEELLMLAEDDHSCIERAQLIEK